MLRASVRERTFVDLSISENPQFVPYKSIGGTEGVRLMCFDGVDARSGRAVYAATFFGDDRNGVVRVRFFFFCLHRLLVLLRGVSCECLLRVMTGCRLASNS